MTHRVCAILLLLLLSLLCGCKAAENDEKPVDAGEDASLDNDDGGTDSENGNASNLDAGLETDSDTSAPWADRQPLTVEALVGTWQKVDYLGTTTMVLASDGTATRQSPDDTVVASFDVGTWSVSVGEEIFTLSYEAGGNAITESSTTALLDDKLYDEVIIRTDGGDDSLAGDWRGSVGDEQAPVENPDDFESTKVDYLLTVVGQSFATTATYSETLIFNGMSNTVDDIYIGRGTMSNEADMIILTYNEQGSLGNLQPLDPPQLEEWGRRIAKNVIYLEGDVDPASDEVYQRVLK